MNSKQTRIFTKNSFERKRNISTLPIDSKKKEILKAVKENQVVILSGSTGTGKTTRVPQFLYNDGYTKDGQIIGVTEPRRIAATAMAEWVGKELHSKKLVSYHIRFENNITENTRILYMTDGVMLKYFLQDANLSKFSVIIVDEAHERSVPTDATIGLLSKRIYNNEVPFHTKIIIMSATMKLEDFTNPHLFEKIPPVIKLDGRQHPVNIYYSPREVTSYKNTIFNKICKIHKTLPDGGILAFVTGQNEIYNILDKLNKFFNFEVEDSVHLKKKEDDRMPVTSASYENIMSDKNEDNHFLRNCDRPLHVLPLYSKLPRREQNRIFQTPPEGKRLCVIATDVAETSITIPNIKYVLDCGLVKQCDNDMLIKTYSVDKISKASADQRTGRAGRESEGYCFRLYTKEEFDKLQIHTDPEILQDPLDDIVLQLKCLGYNDLTKFPFPTKPPESKIKAAEKRLINLGALEKLPNDESRITQIGERLIRFPVHPQFAQILQLNASNDSLQYIIALIASLSIEEIFLTIRLAKTFRLRQDWKTARTTWQTKAVELGDLALYLNATLQSQLSQNSGHFCFNNGLRKEAMLEIFLIRRQLTSIMKDLFPNLATFKFDPLLPLPSNEHIKNIKHSFLKGISALNQLARYHKTDKNSRIYKCMNSNVEVTIHETSLLFKNSTSEYLVYQYIIKNQQGLHFKILFEIDDEELKTLMKSQIHYNILPVPTYSEESDQIVKCAQPSLAGFSLSQEHQDISDTEIACQWFGYYLLKGMVFKSLKCHVQFLKFSLSSLQPTSSDALSIELVHIFYGELMSLKIATKKDLKEEWKKNPNYLRDEYINLLEDKRELSTKVFKDWPPKN